MVCGFRGRRGRLFRCLHLAVHNWANDKATYPCNRQSKYLVVVSTPIRAELECVSRTRTSRPRGILSFYGLVCLSLGFMIFAWGTNYKLSLYKDGHQGSPAKVCIRGSDAAKNALEYAVSERAAAHAPESFAVLLPPFQLTGEFSADRLGNETTIDRSPLSCAPILYLRPPPYERRALDELQEITPFCG